MTRVWPGTESKRLRTDLRVLKVLPVLRPRSPSSPGSSCCPGRLKREDAWRKQYRGERGTVAKGIPWRKRGFRSSMSWSDRQKRKLPRWPRSCVESHNYLDLASRKTELSLEPPCELELEQTRCGSAPRGRELHRRELKLQSLKSYTGAPRQRTRKRARRRGKQLARGVAGGSSSELETLWR